MAGEITELVVTDASSRLVTTRWEEVGDAGAAWGEYAAEQLADLHRVRVAAAQLPPCWQEWVSAEVVRYAPCDLDDEIEAMAGAVRDARRRMARGETAPQ